MKQFYEKYKHAIPLFIYMAIYLTWFSLLEKKVTTYRLIYTPLDDMIPFCEIFIIPYLAWFVYVFACVGAAFFTDKHEYYKSLVFLCTGMTIFLLISTIWPNGHNLRPLVMPRDNMFTRMVENLYHTDTPTNLWPSIHVYNSIGAHLCITHCSYTKHKKCFRIPSFIICVLIILSTMFLKQHSIFDVSMAFLMAIIMTIIVYKRSVTKKIDKLKEKANRLLSVINDQADTAP